MTYSVNTADLDAVDAVFSSASTDVAQLRAALASGAGGPEASSVIGSAQAAGEYSRAFQEWTSNLDQLASSLDTMSRKVSAAAAAYAQTETANTVPPP